MKRRLKNAFSRARVQYSLSLMLGLLSLVVLAVAIQMNFKRPYYVQVDNDSVGMVDELVLSEIENLKGAAEQVSEEELPEEVEQEPEVFRFEDYQQEHLYTATDELEACLNGDNGLKDEERRVECVRLRRKRSCIRRTSVLEGLMRCLEEYGK